MYGTTTKHVRRIPETAGLINRRKMIARRTDEPRLATEQALSPHPRTGGPRVSGTEHGRMVSSTSASVVELDDVDVQRIAARGQERAQ